MQPNLQTFAQANNGRVARRISSPDDPPQRFAFAAFVVGPYLRMHEHSDRANQPMLPVVRDDDCDAIYLLLVTFYEPSMVFKGCNILQRGS